MAFNTDTERMLESASRLEGIRDEVLSSLGRYVMTNQDLTSGAVQGLAALATMRTTDERAERRAAREHQLGLSPQITSNSLGENVCQDCSATIMPAWSSTPLSRPTW